MRPKFPDDESRFPWLSLLFDAYAIIDEGVSLAVGKGEKGLRLKLACRKGCTNCCRLQDIPVYQLELSGIYWYASAKMEPRMRETLMSNLTVKGSGCPFLMEGACSIYPVRPVACRQFNVFGKPCAEGEDPYYTRRHDVLTPIESYTDRAFSVMLSFYGFRESDIRDEFYRHLAIKEVIHTRAESLLGHDWSKLLETING